MEIKYQDAEEKHIRGVCDLVNLMSPAAGDYRDAENRFVTLIKNNPSMRLWVALDGEQVVGTAMLHYQYKLSYHCGIAAHLEDVVVDPEYRKNKIGEALVNIAVDAAKQLGCYKIMLTCYEKTIPYYERLGFKKHDFGMRLSLKEEYPA